MENENETQSQRASNAINNFLNSLCNLSDSFISLLNEKKIFEDKCTAEVLFQLSPEEIILLDQWYLRRYLFSVPIDNDMQKKILPILEKLGIAQFILKS
jgi:hypothetical protein